MSVCKCERLVSVGYINIWRCKDCNKEHLDFDQLRDENEEMCRVLRSVQAFLKFNSTYEAVKLSKQIEEILERNVSELLINDEDESDKYEDYRLEVGLLPCYIDDEVLMYNWCILGYLGRDWHNVSFGWAYTREEVFRDGFKHYNKLVKV